MKCNPPIIMAANERNEKPQNHSSNPSGDWTIVMSRRSKQRRKTLPNMEIIEKRQQSWAPTDDEINPERESRLNQKMQICIKKLEHSQFYSALVDQVQTPQMLALFSRVLGSEDKMQMVIYGIGSIESYEPPRLQLSLAILMKRKFSWIGDIEVFDPVISTTEVRVLQALGCSVMSINEQGRRLALKPTLFYMPHCEAELYNNLLHANWKVELLQRIVLFGNSYEMYERHVSEFKNSVVVDSAKHVLAACRFTSEFAINTVSEEFFGAFHDSSWHFFNLDTGMELPQIQL